MINKVLQISFICLIILKVNARSNEPVTKQQDASVDTICVPDLGTGGGKDGAGNDLSFIMIGSYTLNNGNFISNGDDTLFITAAGNNILNFHNFTLSAGDNLFISESNYQGPLTIKCTGTATINGNIDLSGKTAKNYCTSPRSGPGAAGGPCGGQQGGSGGAGEANGTSGSSFGGAGGGGTFGKYGAGLNGYGSGGGGGNYGDGATSGGNGDNSSGGAAGIIYGAADFSVNLTQSPYTGPLCGGSGGGGGGGGYAGLNAYGAGGGGGGGAIQIIADTINIGNQVAAISVNGGSGGNPGGYGPCTGQPPVGGGGGGGSGGSILLQYVKSYTNNFGSDANLICIGGAGGGGGSYIGGNGGAGRLLVTQVCPLTTAVIENNAGKASVYPNPCTESVNFIFPSGQNITQLILFDMTGRELKCIANSGSRLILKRENLESGIYIYKCFSAGKIIFSGKLIIL